MLGPIRRLVTRTSGSNSRAVTASATNCRCPVNSLIYCCSFIGNVPRISVTKCCSVFLVILLIVVDVTFGAFTASTRRKRYSPAVFPSNSEIEVAWEVGIPVGLEGKDVEVGLFLEADYSLPDNVTYLYPDNILNTYTGKRRRRRTRRNAEKKKKSGPLTRADAFLVIESTMNSLGMDGHSCLLRSICEAAETPFFHGSLVAELLHVLFTPSTTNEIGVQEEYLEAEELGRSGADCSQFFDACPLGIFDIITTTHED